jgi:hypothetical protein
MRRRVGHLLLVTSAVALSVALVALAFFRVTLTGGLRLHPRFDLGGWVHGLPSQLPWVLPFMGLMATLAALRTFVWGRTLPRPAPSWRARFHAMALGGLVQNGLPGSLGVLASAWVLSGRAGTPVGAGLASLLLAKALEFGALVTMTAGMAIVARWWGLGGLVVGPMLWTGLGALAVFGALLAGSRRILPWLARRWGERSPRLSGLLGTLGAGLDAVGSPRRLALGWLVALGPVSASALAYALALRHLGGHPFLLGGGLLVGAVTLAQMTPGLPSNMGLYYFACASTARALGASDEAAATLAVLSHAASNVTQVLVGVVATLASRRSLRDIFRLRRSLESAADRGAALPTSTPSSP